MVSMQYYYYHSAMVLFFNCCTDADVTHAFTILAATDSKMKRASAQYAQFIGPRHHQRSELSRMHHAEKKSTDDDGCDRVPTIGEQYAFYTLQQGGSGTIINHAK